MGSRGFPMTLVSQRSKENPPSGPKLSQTNIARPRMLANGTPPPRPPNHARESLELLRLSPITQTSPGFTVYGPCASVGAVVLEQRQVGVLAEELDVELAALTRELRALAELVVADETARHLPAVDDRVPAVDLERVARQRDHALDEVFAPDSAGSRRP